jgi:hypothetical protein
LAVVICGAAALFTHHGDTAKPEDPTAVFDKHLDTRVQMHDSNQWFLDYQPNTDITLGVTVDRAKGETVDIENWGTGRPHDIKHARVYYPPTKEQLDQQARSAPTVKTDEGEYQIIEAKNKVRGFLKRDVEFALDGSIVKDRSFWENGQRKHTGDRVTDNRYLMDEYAEDGSTLLIHRELVALPRSTYDAPEFLKDPQKVVPANLRVWRVMSGTAYRDGKVWMTAARQMDNALFIDEFSDANVLVSHTVINPREYIATRTYFLADGKTPTIEVEQNSTMNIVRYFENGRKVREANFVGTNKVFDVVFFDEAGKKSFQQHFELKDGLEFQRGKTTIYDYVLTDVKLFDDKDVARKEYVWSHTDGTLTSILEREQGKDPVVVGTEFGVYTAAYSPGVSMHYRSDGTLELILRHDDHDAVTERREVTAEENIRAPEIDPTLTAVRPLDPPLPVHELWNNPFAPKP